VEVAPLVLLTFVENAFKHVSSYFDKPNRVVISLDISDSCLRFEVRNTKEAVRTGALPQENGGIGLANVRRRLELVYPQTYFLDVSDQKDEYRVALQLKLV
jgi:two-component system, LytTR family, sensor kinase